MRIMIALLMVMAFIIGMYIPMRKANNYALIQKQNGAILYLAKDLSAVNCGFKKRLTPNGFCIQQGDKQWKGSKLN